MKIGAIFNDKIKHGIQGRKQSLRIVKDKFSPDDRIIWMHAASLGEYEQGLPVLEKLKQKHPNHKVLITFFSPSGYENVVKKQHLADAICYLPFDEKSNIQRFVKCFKTDVFLTVKYDFWYHLLASLQKKETKVFVVSALFYPNQIYFKPFGKWMVNELKMNVNWFFHQTEESEKLAKKIGLENSSTSGDTRFDRVKQIKNRDNFVEFISEFKENKKIIVFGSSWEAEEKIAEKIAEKSPETKIIIAPHDLKKVENLKKIFPNAILYSEIHKNNNQHHTTNTQILIIDCIGILSKLYFYADLAIVGGGFHSKGLHNILEAATFGVPVFFGNQYKKNPEADGLLLANGGKSFKNEQKAADFILKAISDDFLRENMAKNAEEFIENQPNASEIIIEKMVEIGF